MTESLVLFLQKSSGVHVLHQNYHYITLPHPRSGPVVFLTEDSHIFELQRVSVRKLGCVFTEQKISADSSVYMATQFDPRYLLLPFLANSGGRFCPMDQILTYVEGCSQIPLHAIKTWKMSEMCDVNASLGDDMILYKYNETKALEWLRLKVLDVGEMIARKRRARVRSQQKTHVDSFVLPGRFLAPSETETDADADSGEVLLM